MSLFSIMSPTLRERFICCTALPRSSCPPEWKQETDRAVVAYLRLYQQFVAEYRTRDAQRKAIGGTPIRGKEGHQPEDLLERCAWETDAISGASVGIDAQQLLSEYQVQISEGHPVWSGIEDFDGPASEWTTSHVDLGDSVDGERGLAETRARIMSAVVDAARESDWLTVGHVEALEDAASEGEPGWNRFSDLLIGALLTDAPRARDMMYRFAQHETLTSTAAAQGCSRKNVGQQLDSSIRRLIERTVEHPAIHEMVKFRVEALHLAERWDRLQRRLTS